MAWTRDWNETTPVGSTTNASDIDLWLRYAQIDTAERLESMFYGFNNSSSAAPEDAYGVKHLKLYPQTSPTSVSNYGFLFGKDASSKIELHYLDEDGDEIQITSGGGINGAATLAASIPAGSFVADAVDSDDIAGGAVDLAHMSVNSVDSDQYVDGSIDAVHIANLDPDDMSGFSAFDTTDQQYKIVFPNSLIMVTGYEATAGGDDVSVTMTGITNVFSVTVCDFNDADSDAYPYKVKSITGNVIVFASNAASGVTDGFFYTVYGK